MGEASVRQRVLLVGAATLVATVLVAVLPDLRFAYVSATARVAMEAAQAVIAGLVAVLVHGRFQRRGSRLDLLLVVALGTSAVANLTAVVVRAANEDETILSELVSWASLGTSLAAACAYAAAAHLRDRTVVPGSRSARTPLAMVGGAVLAVWLVATPLAERLPATVTGEVGDGSRPALEASAGAYVAHAAILALLVAGAIGFARRATERPDDALLRAVGTGLVLAAVARLNFILYPSIHTTVVHTGDLARLAFYLVLLRGAAGEISGYWRDRTQLAVLEERRRIARELHDGMMQELSFIRSQVSAFERQDPTPASIGFVAAAAERALAESRQAVEALSDEGVDALDRIVRRTVGEVADRAGLLTRFDLAPGIHLEPQTAEQLRRIVREATANVVRHAGASMLTVSLRRRGDEVRLIATDDGRGFDAAADSAGFGLRGMRERAASVGGTLVVEPATGGGCRVVLRVPVRGGVDVEGQVAGDQLDQRDGVA